MQRLNVSKRTEGEAGDQVSEVLTLGLCWHCDTSPLKGVEGDRDARSSWQSLAWKKSPRQLISVDCSSFDYTLVHPLLFSLPRACRNLEERAKGFRQDVEALE